MRAKHGERGKLATEGKGPRAEEDRCDSLCPEEANEADEWSRSSPSSFFHYPDHTCYHTLHHVDDHTRTADAPRRRPHTLRFLINERLRPLRRNDHPPPLARADARRSRRAASDPFLPATPPRCVVRVLPLARSSHGTDGLLAAPISPTTPSFLT